jgi:hypothetical protein
MKDEVKAVRMKDKVIAVQQRFHPSAFRLHPFFIKRLSLLYSSGHRQKSRTAISKKGS